MSGRRQTPAIATSGVELSGAELVVESGEGTGSRVRLEVSLR